MHNKIYSRNKIRLPKIIMNTQEKNGKYKNVEKIWKIILILFIAFGVVKIVLDAVNPIFDTLCEDEAKSIATIISNEQATKVIEKYKYEDLFSIEKDKKGNITMIKSNIFTINAITSDIGINIQKEMNSTERKDINIALGSFTGIKLLSGRGPYVKIRISSIGNVETDLRSEFISQGINQTLHRVYLQVECKVSILTPFSKIEKKITNQVILAENVIVGQIPETYYSLEGFENEKDTLELME